MNIDIYSQIYNKLNQLLNKSGGIEQFMDGSGYLKLKSTGYMDLTVEQLTPDTLSITHYYQQNGDLVPDPDMTVRILFEQKQAEVLTFQNCMVFWEVYPDENKVDLKKKKELNTFLNFWLKNLKDQGFYN